MRLSMRAEHGDEQLSSENPQGKSPGAPYSLRPLTPEEWYSRYVATGRVDFIEDYPEMLNPTDYMPPPARIRDAESQTPWSSKQVGILLEGSMQHSIESIYSLFFRTRTVMPMMCIALAIAAVGGAEFDHMLAAKSVVAPLASRDQQLVYVVFDHVGAWW